MPFVRVWESQSHKPYLSYTHIRVATRHQHFMARERSQSGRLGKCTMMPQKHDSEHFQVLERLTVVLYDKSSPSNSINETRRSLFCHENRTMEKLPPTQDALLQHVKRVVFQAGIWTSSTRANQDIPSPQDFGWTKDSGSWLPVWMTISDVSKACQKLVKCSCKGNCSTCKCGKANIDCSPLCKCNCAK